jgi:hypothetical protein
MNRFAIPLAMILMTSAASGQGILYVDDDAAAGGDGMSWSSAYRFLQEALAAAPAGTEIRVGQGTYLPDRDEANPLGTGDRLATFQLINGVTLTGGYAGIGSPDPDDRDVDTYLTLLSGDFSGNDMGEWWDLTRRENARHVVTGSATDGTAVLDGFVVLGGYSTSGWSSGAGLHNDHGSPSVIRCTFSGNIAQLGGGMANWDSSPTIVHCTFIGNIAIGNDDGKGGGMYNDNSAPVVIDCTFADNWVGVDGGCADCVGFAPGGGMYNGDSSPLVTGCTFDDNSASSGGGMYNRWSSPTVRACTFLANRGSGMTNDESNPTVTDCMFTGNWRIGVAYPRPFATGTGGGMDNWDSSPTVANCVFSGNVVNAGGGGMANFRGSNPVVINSIFCGNSVIATLGIGARLGGGMCNKGLSNPTVLNCTFSGNVAESWYGFGGDGGGIASLSGSAAAVTNCVFWANSPAQILDDEHSATTVSHSVVQGGWLGPGANNVDADPMFARDPDDGGDGFGDDPETHTIDEGANDDYGDLHVLTGSPCIDAGHNNAIAALTDTDLDGNPRCADDPATADTGCGVPVVVDMGAYEYQGDPAEVVYADLTGDGIVGLDDFDTLLDCWSSAGGPCCLADLNLDGVVGVVDFLILLANWGP